MPSPRQRRARRMLKRPIWQIELHGIFLENAEVHHQETGPEMSVEVCYVHHTRLPICRAPRPVRLDNIQDLWYADLCNAWFDQIQRQQPLRVHIVKPSPAYQTRPQAVIHILLEQGMTPTRVAILFTAAAGGAFAMHGLARETAILHVRVLVIVHFFSGYRRMGDIHHVVEHRTVNRVPTSSPSQSTSACSARITTWQRLKQPNGGEPVS